MNNIVVADPESHREAICSLTRELYDYQANTCGYLSMKENGSDLWWKQIQPMLGSFAQIFVATQTENGGAIIGFIVVRVKVYPSYLDSAPRGLISELFVLPEHRHQGLAQDLFARAKDWLMTKNISDVELNTVAHNDSGEYFWKACGFKPELTQWNMSLP